MLMQSYIPHLQSLLSAPSRAMHGDRIDSDLRKSVDTARLVTAFNMQ